MLLGCLSDAEKRAEYFKALQRSVMLPTPDVDTIPTAMEDLSTDTDVLNLVRLILVKELEELMAKIAILTPFYHHQDIDETSFTEALQQSLKLLAVRTSQLSKCEKDELVSVLFGTEEVDNPFKVVDRAGDE
jgi:hypothetical protein